MSLPIETRLSARLAAHVRAGGDVPDAATRAAQDRLITRLQTQSRPAQHAARRPWLALATSLAIAVVVVLAAPMFSTGGHAFAAVQQHFRDFRTLAMDITQRYNGDVLQTSRTVVNADGVLRTDVGSELSIIVDRAHGRTLTLLHDTREAVVGEIPTGPPSRDAALRWLDELRVFKGKATPIAGSRHIDGHAAQGWRLDLDGTSLELWADADGLPLSMRQSGAAGVEIDYRFTFNQPLSEDQLISTPPADYRVVAAEAD